MILLIAACAHDPATPPEASTIPEVAPVPAVIPEVAPAPGIPEVAPAPGIPEVTPVQPVVGDVEDAFRDVPAEVSRLYRITLSPDRSGFTADPAAQRETRKATRSAGFSTETTARGGKRVTLDGGPITAARWTRSSLLDLVSDEAERRAARAAGFTMDAPTDVLELVTEDGGTTRFAFGGDAGRLGLLGVCSDVTLVPFVGGKPQMAVRKPVVYLYPEVPTDVVVRVEPDGPLTAVYPALQDGAWSVRAHPDGRLVQGDRTHRYLFWESEAPAFDLDPADAHLVAREHAVGFLETLCDRNGLEDTVCGDLVTYWLPELQAHPYTLVAFPGEAYTRWAPLTVEPRPDAVVRLYFVLQGLEEPVRVGSPPLPSADPSGFTVVEWGGSSLPPQASGRSRP
ncbi:MAG: hypothetical protein H6734_12075 [Alphaproteobacteria bacterium]|nr:hypothetical protein [Alphaproteobacteria bacterium]